MENSFFYQVLTHLGLDCFVFSVTQARTYRGWIETNIRSGEYKRKICNIIAVISIKGKWHFLLSISIAVYKIPPEGVRKREEWMMEPTERCGGSGGSEAIDGHIEGDRPGSLDGTEQKRDEEEEVYTTTSSRHVNTLKKTDNIQPAIYQ